MRIPEPAVIHARSTVNHSGPFSFPSIAALARIILGAFVFLAFISSTTHAQWQSFDRPEEDFRGLAFIGPTLYALASPVGLHSSIDEGGIWFRESWSADYGEEVFCLSVINGTPIAGGSKGRFFAGAWQWQRQAVAGVEDDIQAIGSTRRDTLSIWLLGGFGGGVRRSTDAGHTWSLCNEGLTDLNVTSFVTLARPGDSSQSLFAGTYGGGVFRSDDNGSQWSTSSTGLADLHVYALTAHADTIFAAHSGGCVSRSVDAGATWVTMSAGLPYTDVISLARVTTPTACYLFAGTIDKGIWRHDPVHGTWDSVNTGVKGVRINAILVRDTSIFIATERGVYRSDKFGSSWRPIDRGTRPLVSSVAAIAPASGSPRTRIFIENEGHEYSGSPIKGSSSTVCWTDDLGKTWTTTPFHPYLITTQSRSNHFAVQHNACVFLTNSSWGEYSCLECLLSTNSGVSWGDRLHEFAFRYGGVAGAAIREVPLEDRFEVYILVSGGPYPGLWCSSDSGKTWTEKKYSPRERIRLPLIVDGSAIYATTGASAVRSSDGGKTWDSIMYNGVYPYYTPPNSIYSRPMFTLLHANSTRLFARVVPAIIPGDPGGLYASTDHGTTWTPAGFTGLSVDRIIASDSVLFALQNGHVFASRTDTLLWKDVSGELTTDSIVVISASPEYLVALTEASDRIWYRPMAEIKEELNAIGPTAIKRSGDDLPVAVALFQNYPNPFNPSTTIGYQLPVSGHVRLAVFDLLGREVAVLVNERKEAGTHTVTFEAAGLASGVYFYRLTTPGRVETRRMNVLR